MAIVNKLMFTKKHLKSFATLLRNARKSAGMSQMAVARQAFGYKLSHCKVSRIERSAMSKVDAVAIERMASVFGIPRVALEAIDASFAAKASIAATASRKGFWGYTAEMV